MMSDVTHVFQVKKLQSSISRLPQLEKDKNEYMKELANERTKIVKLSQEFEELQKTQETENTKLKSSNVQVSNYWYFFSL